MKIPLALVSVVTLSVLLSMHASPARGKGGAAPQQGKQHDVSRDRRERQIDHETVKLGAKQVLHLRNLNGAVVTSGGGTAGELEVTATARAANHGDVKAATVVTKSDANNLTVCVLFDKHTTCEADGTMTTQGGGDDPGVEVTLTVKLPPGVTLDVSTVNGAVTARGVDGALLVTTVNGPIDADAAGDAKLATVNGAIALAAGGGTVDAHTVNGNVDVTLGAKQTGDVKVATLNGAIDLRLAGGLDAEVDAAVQNGVIRIAGKSRGDHVRETLGKGGRKVRAETQNGAIAIH